MKKLLLILICIICNVDFCYSQYILKGVVRDTETGLTIKTATISTKKGKTGVISDENGYFTITIQKLPETIIFSHVAYGKKEIKFIRNDFAGSNEKYVSIELQPKGLEMPMAGIEEYLFGKIVDTTPKIDFIDFTISYDHLIYALVKLGEEIYLRVYNLNDSVLAEQKVDKKYERIISDGNEIVMGTAFSHDLYFDDVTECYRWCYYENNKLTLLPERELITGGRWNWKPVKLDGLYYKRYILV